MISTIKQWFGAALDVVLPRSCPVCGKALGSDEPWLCRRCLRELPLTHLDQVPFNAMEQLFAGKVPIERATGYFYYEKGSPYAAILHDIKYRHVPRMAQWLAARALREMPPFANGITTVVPVPLHADKLARRGYNQSEYIARGVAQATGATVVQAVKAVRSHTTQTHKGALERWQNIQGAYGLARGMEQRLAGMHVLLVDDVVTTGSTLEACAATLLDVPNITVSLFTLAVARLD